MKINDYTAVGICEGFIPDDENQLNDAWQHLINTGVAWQLQAHFGREANRRIEMGESVSPVQRT